MQYLYIKYLWKRLLDLQCDQNKQEGEVGPCWDLEAVVEDCSVANNNTDKEGQKTGHERTNKVTGETESNGNKVVAILSTIAVLHTQYLHTMWMSIIIL